jgi:hypothetical protein
MLMANVGHLQSVQQQRGTQQAASQQSTGLRCRVGGLRSGRRCCAGRCRRRCLVTIGLALRRRRGGRLGSLLRLCSLHTGCHGCMEDIEPSAFWYMMQSVALRSTMRS